MKYTIKRVVIGFLLIILSCLMPFLLNKRISSDWLWLVAGGAIFVASIGCFLIFDH